MSKRVIYQVSLKELSDRNQHMRTEREVCQNLISEKESSITDERQIQDLEEDAQRCPGYRSK